MLHLILMQKKNVDQQLSTLTRREAHSALEMKKEGTSNDFFAKIKEAPNTADDEMMVLTMSESDQILIERT